MVSLENKKLLHACLKSARVHADRACRFKKSELAAREIHAAVADLTTALNIIVDVLHRRPELYCGTKRME